MKNILRYIPVLILTSLLAVSITGCGGDNSVTGSRDNDTYDVDANGIPQFVGADYIELDNINKISKFRSSAGHDYSDDFELCRSMKHYYWPKGGSPGGTHEPSWTTIKIFSPINGTFSKIYQEWAGEKIEIKSDEYPAFYFTIFHVDLNPAFDDGDRVYSGQQIGTHASDETMSDVAVGVNTPNVWKLISYFDVMTDSLFQVYQARGLNSRNDVIISKEARDDDPLTCEGETFTNAGNLENWVVLN